MTIFNFKNILLINYQKINKLPVVSTGYDMNIGQVVKRYRDYSSKPLDLMHDYTAKDNLYFIEKECSEWLLNKEFNMLDVGCGNGSYETIFSHKRSPINIKKYSGCEFDKHLVDLCKEFHKNGFFFQSMAERIDAKDSFFDLVFCSGVLHYVKFWRKAIQEMSRVSKKYILITRMPLTKYEKEFAVHQKVFGIQGIENHYFTVPNRDEFEKNVLNNKLKILKRDYSSEVYNIKGIREKIVLSQYLLEK